jgi:hypothetical protein
VDSYGSGYRPMAGFCEHGNANPGSIRRREIPVWRVLVRLSKRTRFHGVS